MTVAEASGATIGTNSRGTLPEGLAAARELERRGEAEQALSLLAGLRAAHPAAPAAWLHQVALLRRLKRFDEAEQLIGEAVRRFAVAAKVWSEWASTAQARGDWQAAVERWHVMLSRFPDQIAAHLFGGVAYRELGRWEAADLLLLEAQRRFPADPAPWVEYAQVAHRARDWPEAARRWAEVRSRFPLQPLGYKLGAAALRELARPEEAEALLAQASAPADKSAPAVERARAAETRANWPAAARAWGEVAELDPRSSDAPARQASALRKAGRLDAADRLIATALERFPDAADIAEQHGLNAAAREDWPLALARLEAAARRHPSEARLRQRVYEVQLRIAGTGTGAAPPPLVASPNDDPDRVLAMAFESLGGTGHGCEFGVFQRSLNADTLGLLRWADLGHEALCTALETEFPGVGEPEFTRIFIPVNNDRREYWATDHRFHMAMRTFVYADEMPPERMAQVFRQRQLVLRRKLVEDLREGQKIFVYKNMRRNLTEQELARLHAAVRRYGDATLFVIRYADAEHPPGEVELARPGLILGNIDRFSHHPETDELLGPAHGMLLALCRKASAAWQAARTNAAT